MAPNDSMTSRTGPVGHGNHVVRNGECLTSIAFAHGHFWETLWNHPENSELKDVREDPNVILPGDQLEIPELVEKEESRGCEARHIFRRKGVPAQLRLRFLKPKAQEDQDDDPNAGAPVYRGKEVITEDLPQDATEEWEPRANVPYALTIDGVRTEGKTDHDGRVETAIPPNAQQGTIVLNPETAEEEEIALNLGRLDPISEVTGVKQRLRNLGFDAGDMSAEESEGLVAALNAFQEAHGLTLTGEADEETREKLNEVHGS